MSDHESTIMETLRHAWSREQAAGREPVYTRTPIDEMISREDGEAADAYLARVEAMRDLMGYFFADVFFKPFGRNAALKNATFSVV